MSYYGFGPYVPVAKRRAQAAREMEKLRKKGKVVSPVVIEGRKIASSFWGKAWCENLERYSDYENRLPRGRTYLRNGSVIDLQIARGQIQAIVSGSETYAVNIVISTVPPSRWKAIRKDCTGSIGSLVELLKGRLSKNVMERVCRAGAGLFPSPSEITMKCSCPDGARVCKHVAATLYGAGARLDEAPDLLFTLRGVDHSELIASAGEDLPITKTSAESGRILAHEDISALFGIDVHPEPAALGVNRATNFGQSTKTSTLRGTRASTKKPTGTAATATLAASPTVTKRLERSAAAKKGSLTKGAFAPAIAVKVEPPVKAIRALAKASGTPVSRQGSPIAQSESTLPRRIRTRAARWINSRSTKRR
jgi:uncharacterized Zn finger protein